LEKIDLNATARTGTGNGPARVMRRDGRVPAILYGRNTEPMLLSVNIHELELVLKKHSINQVLLNLVINNGGTVAKPAMIKELQTHPVSRKYLHVDFYEIDMQRKIRVDIPVVATGKSIGVENGGVVQVVRRDLEVLCLPGEIPESIIIDITNLDMGDSVHVKEIPLPEGVEIPADVNFTVLTILSPRVEVEAEEGEGEEEEGEAAEAEEASDEDDEA
jgi:large subunit ribosomal protein L25